MDACVLIYSYVYTHYMDMQGVIVFLLMLTMPSVTPSPLTSHGHLLHGQSPPV